MKGVNVNNFQSDDFIGSLRFIESASNLRLDSENFLMSNRVKIIYKSSGNLLFSISRIPSGSGVHSNTIFVPLCKGHKDELADLVRRAVSLNVKESKKKLKKLAEKLGDEL